MREHPDAGQDVERGMGRGEVKTGRSDGGDGGRAAPRGGRDAVVARVLDAAEQLFSDHPYADVSVRAIADAAGVSHALVHRYVGAKADILRAVLARHEDLFADAAREATSVRQAAAAMLAGDPEATRRYFRLVLRVSMDSVLREVADISFAATRLLTRLSREQAAAAGGRATGVEPGFAVAAVVALAVGLAGLDEVLLKEVGLADLDRAAIDDQLRLVVDMLFAATLPGPPDDG